MENYPEKFDYGHVIVTRHEIDNTTVYALHGHLSASSFKGRKIGQQVKKGEVLGWMGSKTENGDWFPHVHFQLCLLEPVIADIPGVVSGSHRKLGTALYPDPRLVLGPIFH